MLHKMLVTINFFPFYLNVSHPSQYKSAAAAAAAAAAAVAVVVVVVVVVVCICFQFGQVFSFIVGSSVEYL